MQEQTESPVDLLIQEGENMKRRLLTFLQLWPKDSDSFPLPLAQVRWFEAADLRECRTELRSWFNRITQYRHGRTAYGTPFLTEKLQQVERIFDLDRFLGTRDARSLAMEGPKWIPDAVAGWAARQIDDVVDLLKSMPDGTKSMDSEPFARANTAFVLMWMDQSNYELEDICETLKHVCQQFGIEAKRADDVEHQELITEVVLNYIQNSEFLIADLTGERPNVYYEIGYAHALNKRPILCRKKGTKLHFDIAGYNVIEYKNVTDLGNRLRDRLAAVTGRHPADA